MNQEKVLKFRNRFTKMQLKKYVFNDIYPRRNEINNLRQKFSRSYLSNGVILENLEISFHLVGQLRSYFNENDRHERGLRLLSG